MKIENRGMAPLDTKITVKASTPQKNQNQDESKIAKSLQEAIVGIETFGSKASDVHQNSSLGHAEYLLNMFEAESKRPKLSNDALLSFADQTAKLSLEQPHQALQAFHDFDGSRIQELLSEL